MSVKRREPTAKQKLFCKNYIIDLNGARAYKEVYKCKEQTARVNACMLLTNTNNRHIQEYISHLMEKRAKKYEVTAERVIAEISKIAFSKATDFLEINNKDIVVKDLSNVDTTAIEEAENLYSHNGKKTGVKIKFHDKVKCLDLLMKHLGQYKNRVELSVDKQIENWLRGKADE